MVRDSLSVILVGIAVLGLASGCGGPATNAAATHNVILISVDTLRADHLGCYGYPKPTTPRIDAFRRDAALFEQAIAHAPSTLASHASIFTSLLPSHHGASAANSFGVDPEAITLTEILKAEGYATASFNGGIQLDPIYGLDRGFDVYRAARPSVASADLLVDPVDMFDHAVDEAINWIETVETNRHEGFFLFLHTYELHHPYTPKPEALESIGAEYDGSLPKHISVDLLMRINDGDVELETGDLEHIISTYDAELRSVDTAFGRLIDFLREEELYDDTIIVFTSDHGEEFGERGFVGWHSHTLYDELLRVPLLVKLPGAAHAGASVEEQVRGIDIAPTILAALGLDAPAGFEGVSLLGPLSGSGSVPEHAVSRKDVVITDDFASVRTPDWKWFRGSLFHLASDPEEATEVSGANMDTGEALSAKLEELSATRPRPAPHKVVPDEELLNQLRSLGYVK